MSFTASDVKELRDRTGAGMMDCKKALTENDGDLEKAIEWLQVKGIAKAAKKADRIAADGRVATFVSDDGKTGAIVEINCETDFVARNDDFAAFSQKIVEHAAAVGTNSVDELLASSLDGTTIEEIRKAKVAAIGENITIRRVGVVTAPEGTIGTYVHGEGLKGALVSINTSGAASNDALAEIGKQVSMHAVAMAPRFLDQNDIDDATVETERRIQTEAALESGKPREIVEKMIEGRLRKWKQEICLVDQPFVMNPDLTVGAHVASAAKEAGIEKAKLDSFVLFVRGEGIEKKEMNFADEVAAMAGQG
jgi:elongation factor Ts